MSKAASSSVRRLRQSASAAAHRSPEGACSRPCRYSKVVSSGPISPALAPASMDMLHTVMRPSIDSALITGPRYSMMRPTPPVVPMRPMMARITSLAPASGGSSPADRHRHRARPHLGQGLGGQHVLHLAGADAEGDGPEGAVGGGVGVAAHDGHARLGEALLGADHMHDALLGVAHREVGDPELVGVAAQGLHLGAADLVGDGLVDVGGGDVVVLGGHRQVGPPHAPARQPQPVEGLRRGHLMHEVQVDVEQVGLAVAAPGPPYGGPRSSRSASAPRPQLRS